MTAQNPSRPPLSFAFVILLVLFLQLFVFTVSIIPRTSLILP